VASLPVSCLSDGLQYLADYVPGRAEKRLGLQALNNVYLRGSETHPQTCIP